jgi:hypothetical protein
MISIHSEHVHNALKSDAIALRVMEKQKFPKSGDLVGIRLNLNVLKNTGVAVQTIHQATNQKGYTRNKGFYNGEAIGYAGAVRLKNAYFNVDQTAREEIAIGLTSKYPMASIDGQFVDCPSEIDGGTEVRFNPKDVHLFVDMNNRAIRSAEEVIIVGHRAYAFGSIEYYNEKTAPARAGNYPTNAKIEEVVHHSYDDTASHDLCAVF